MSTSVIEPVPSRLFDAALPLSMVTTLCLYVVAVGYVVFILPVLANFAASWNYSLSPSGPDLVLIAQWTIRSTVAVLLGWLVYARRRPLGEQPKQLAMAVGTLNVMLGASLVMLGVTLVRFVYILVHSLR